MVGAAPEPQPAVLGISDCFSASAWLLTWGTTIPCAPFQGFTYRGRLISSRDTNQTGRQLHRQRAKFLAAGDVVGAVLCVEQNKIKTGITTVSTWAGLGALSQVPARVCPFLKACFSLSIHYSFGRMGWKTEDWRIGGLQISIHYPLSSIPILYLHYALQQLPGNQQA
jgi:hypothetical protein